MHSFIWSHWLPMYVLLVTYVLNSKARVHPPFDMLFLVWNGFAQIHLQSVILANILAWQANAFHLLNIKQYMLISKSKIHIKRNSEIIQMLKRPHAKGQHENVKMLGLRHCELKMLHSETWSEFWASQLRTSNSLLYWISWNSFLNFAAEHAT